jgi:hypothetical protein
MAFQEGGAYMAGGAYGQGQGDFGMAGGAYGQGQGDFGMAGGAYGQGQGDFGIDGKGQGMMAMGMMAPGMMAPGMGPGMDPMMAGRVPMTQSDRIEEIEKRQIKTLKADTYKQRRKEGRPKHGSTSMAVMVLGSIALMMQSGTLFYPCLRSNNYGVFGYGAHRAWGFIGIKGKTFKLWHEIAIDTCGYFGALNVGGVCASPICLWYKLKCESYMTFMVVSYSAMFVLVISYLLHVAIIIWTALHRPRTIRYAGKCWPIVLILNLTGSVVWFILSEEMFDELMSKSFYPTPEVGGGLYASGMSSVLLLVCTFCGCQLWKWWPDIDLAEWDSSEDEEEDDEDEDDKDDSDTDDERKAKKGKKKGKNAQGGVGPGMGVQAPMQQSYGMSQAGMGMQYVQPQEGFVGAAVGAGPVYSPGQEDHWESQPAELRKGATYMPQQPGGDMIAQAPSAGYAEGAPQQQGNGNNW